MADRHSIPPLRQLPAVQLDARRDHLLTEINHESRRSPLKGTPRRLVVLGACAIAAAAIASALALSLGGSSTPDLSGRGSSLRGEPFPYRIRLRYVRRSGVLVAIPLTVKAPYINASVRVKVVRGPRPLETVFEHSAPMHDIAHPSRFGMRSTWSSVLRPVQWRGGCQHAPYKIEVFFRRGGPSRRSFAARFENGSFFRCR